MLPFRIPIHDIKTHLAIYVNMTPLTARLRTRQRIEAVPASSGTASLLPCTTTPPSLFPPSLFPSLSKTNNVWEAGLS